jgi:hypothetical protein
MSDAAPEETTSPAPRRPSGCCLTLGLLAIPIFFLMMMAGIGQGLVDLSFSLLFGWIAFLRDTVPRISWDWGAIAAGTLFTGLLLILGHSFLSWLGRGIASARGTTFRWPWKWTWCGLGGIALCLLVGMAVAGAAHQIGWIAGRQESLFESRPLKLAHYAQMHEVRRIAVECLKRTNSVEGLRQQMPTLFQDPERRSWRLPATLQSFQLLLLVGSNAAVQGILILPRDPETQRKFGGEYVGQASGGPLKAEALRQFIESNQTNLVAF